MEKWLNCSSWHMYRTTAIAVAAPKKPPSGVALYSVYAPAASAVFWQYLK